MKLNAQSLNNHLKNNALPLYWVSGDEPLLVQECLDNLRENLKAKGFLERDVYDLNSNFDWPQFILETKSLSLFAEKSIIELRLNDKKLPDAGKKALQSYLQNPSPEKVIIISSAKLEAQTLKTKWFTAIEQLSALIQIWPIDSKELPKWISQRLLAQGLNADAASVELLTEFGEGNLLAIKQDIEKLSLLHPNAKLTVHEVEKAISDNARFNIFDLSDAMLAGETLRAIRILKGLKSQGTETILILWAIVRELRTLSNLQNEKNINDQLLRRNGIWPKRMPLVKKALARGHQYKNYLNQALHIDALIKGVTSGDVWDSFEDLVIALS